MAILAMRYTEEKLMKSGQFVELILLVTKESIIISILSLISCYFLITKLLSRIANKYNLLVLEK